MKKKLNIIGLIPARWGSTRFVGKPLAEISGKSMIRRVYEQAKKSKLLNRVIVVTDDERIKEECLSHSMECILKKIKCHTGTDRIADAIEYLNADIYVNIQGDEPLIDPKSIDKVIKELTKSKNIATSNAYTEIKESYKVIDSDVVKVIFNKKFEAVYYSRSPIPYPKTSNHIFFQQLGLYAFKKNALKKFKSLKPGKLEISEGIEMLRFLENELIVKMVKVDDIGLSVDAPKDIKFIENFLKKESNV